MGIATYHGSIPRNTFKSNEESPLVDKRFEISNFDLVRDVTNMLDFIESHDLE